MSKEIKIDLSKVEIRYYIQWTMEPGNIQYLYAFLDKAVVGGISDRSVTELPAILARLMAELNEFNTEIQLAIGSMKSHLLGD